MTLTDSPHPGSPEPDPDAPTTVTPGRPRQRPGRRTVIVIVVAVLVLLGIGAAILGSLFGGRGGPDDAAITRALGGAPGGGAPAAAAPPAAGAPGQGVPLPAGGGRAPGPDGAAGPGGRDGGVGPLLGAVSHGEFALDSSAGGRVVDVQRGEVTAVTPTSIDVRSADGFTATYRLEAGVAIRKGGEQITVSSLAAGDDGLVVATRDAAGLRATTVTID